jgi:Ca2+-binding EF-hand superfamily protein
MDADNDGMVSKTEFMNYMSAEFDNLDVNKAGKLDITELKKLNITQPHTGGGSK